MRTIKPVNVRDNVLVNGNFNFGFAIKPLNGRFSFGPTVNMSRGINLLNNLENQVRQQKLGGSARGMRVMFRN